jgi:hypothetical protein
MVLKRKLPTQESKTDIKSEQIQEDKFDMSIETDEKIVEKKGKGHDVNDSFPEQMEDKPEDFIPAELLAMETGSIVANSIDNKGDLSKSKAETEDENLQNEQENEEIEPVAFDDEDEFAKNNLTDEDEPFDMSTDTDYDASDAVLNDNISKNETSFNPFEQGDDEPAQLPTAEEQFGKGFEQTPLADVAGVIPEVDLSRSNNIKEDSFVEENEDILPALEEDVLEDNESNTELTNDEDVFSNKDKAIEINQPILDEVPSMEFDTQEHVNWQEVTNSSNSNYKDDSFDSFETIDFSNESKINNKKKTLGDNEDFPMDPFNSDNGGIIPEIPGLETDFSKPAEFVGQNSKDINLSGDAKRNLVIGSVAALLLVGGILVYSNMGKTTEVANRWTGALTEANQDIAQTKEEEKELLKDGIDVTKAETVIDFSKVVDKENEEADYLDDLDSEDSDNTKEADATTQINLLEPEVIKKTASGKEVITAKGDEKLPEEVEEGANLISNITAELEKQKAKKLGLDTLEESKSDENSTEFKGSPADINKKVDDQLAEYRKLLAQEEDPGKKVKPGKFFSGAYEETPTAVTKDNSTATSVNISKVNLTDEATSAENYDLSSGKIEGHNIVEYPKGVAREPDDGIRKLDHFRSLLVEKEDKRVRMPRNVQPGLRNQGFPQFKVISIVPNYGLIGEYSDKKGILMIGDMFKGWELIGVYDTYAEFKKDTRKHIISLK